MSLCLPRIPTSALRRHTLSVLLVVVLCSFTVGLLWKFGGRKVEPETVSIDRAVLEMRDGVWYAPGQAVPFTGSIVDHDSDGRLRLRSSVVEGRLHGMSIGWGTNGVPELQERFQRGTPDGARVTWFPNGRKRSEGMLSSGLQQGTFREWDENGVLVVEAEFLGGKPHGPSRAWYPDGSLKAEALMEHGEVKVRHVYTEGQRREPAALAGSAIVLNPLEHK